MSSYSNISKLFDSLEISDWVKAAQGDWHTWLYHYVKSVSLNAFNLTLANSTFGRYGITKNSSFKDAVRIQHDWRDSVIINQLSTIGRKTLENKIWNKEVVNSALNKLESNYFDRYK